MQFTDGFSYSNLWFSYELPKFNRNTIGKMIWECRMASLHHMDVAKINTYQHLLFHNLI